MANSLALDFECNAAHHSKKCESEHLIFAYGRVWGQEYFPGSLLHCVVEKGGKELRNVAIQGIQRVENVAVP